MEVILQMGPFPVRVRSDIGHLHFIPIRGGAAVGNLGREIEEERGVLVTLDETQNLPHEQILRIDASIPDNPRPADVV